MTVVALGYHGPRPRDGNDPRSRVLYLPDQRVIVAVQCRTRHGWRCTVIANPGHHHEGHGHGGQVTLTDDDLAHAHTTLTADPIREPALYTLLWQTRVRQRWPGGHTHAVARIIATHLRPAGALTVDIDQRAATRLVTAAHLRVPGLRRLLTRITDASMLTPDPPDRDSRGSHTLTIPTATYALDSTARRT